MGLFNSIVSAVTNPTNLLALATMNPAIIAATMGRQLVSALGQQVIQQIGEQMGLPQSAIDAAQGAFAGSMGDVQGAKQNYQEALSGLVNELQDLGANPRSIGDMLRAADAFERKGGDLVSEFINRRLNDEDGDEAGGVPSSGKGSVLMRIAVALGKNLDEKMANMANKADELGALGSNTDMVNEEKSGGFFGFGGTTKTSLNAEGQTKYGELSAELQVLGQEIKILQEALSNTIKSIGESTSAMARKN